MHAEHAIGRFSHGGFTRACRVMATVPRYKLALLYTSTQCLLFNVLVLSASRARDRNRNRRARRSHSDQTNHRSNHPHIAAASEHEQEHHAIFNLFERFPDDDGSGVFWSALHGMEAVGSYETLLLQYFRRWPSLMTTTMLRRLMNAGETQIGDVSISTLQSD